MYFRHAPEIWQNYPQLVPGLLVVDDIHPDVELESVVQPFLEQARQNLQQYGTESKIPSVSAWRRAYSQMGLKPTKYRSAAEALLRRFRKVDDLPRLHPLVDLCNAVSLAFALPVAVFDLAQVDGYLEVRYAAGSEEYLAFNGEIENPTPQEVIFADAANHVHARRWTFRQSRQSTITPQSKQVLIVSEALHETAARDENRLVNELAQNISALWSSPRQQAILSADNPRLDL